MKIALYSRRHFLGQCAALSAVPGLGCVPSLCGAEKGAGKEMNGREKWLKSLEDPVRKLFPGKPDLDTILGLFARTTGEPAFDPHEIAAKAKTLRTSPQINTGHTFLDHSVRIGLAHIDATFDGDHPKYGVGVYEQPRHDGFPPTIIAAVDALSAWGLNARAGQLFRYWLKTFVRDDGSINYYGPSISEYGQLLYTARLLEQRAGPGGWWQDGSGALDRIVERLLKLRAEAGRDGLIAGAPEADTRKHVSKYFHNNGWVVKGLRAWAELCKRRDAAPSTSPKIVASVAGQLCDDTLRAVKDTWPADPNDWWLSPRVEPTERPDRATATRDASYTNYRYWPELLSSDLLPPSLANRVVAARLTAGGQFCGMTRFHNHLDDWTLAEYLSGLWSLGRKNDFLLSLYGHVAYHQAEGHLTAYEQVTFPPGKMKADYCLPSQLVAARAARRINMLNAD
ncbi:MAG: hypothetical protein U9N87_01485 [Planctomycetota bacterium]|nr:hypothetical protein [Planctomycetota bacterium]